MNDKYKEDKTKSHISTAFSKLFLIIHIYVIIIASFNMIIKTWNLLLKRN
jgi:hypothetical protein